MAKPSFAQQLLITDTICGGLYSSLKLFLGQELKVDMINEFVRRVCIHLPHVNRDNILNSIFPYVGMTLTDRVLLLLARQLAARREILTLGPISLLDTPQRSGWAATEIVKLTETTWNGDDAKRGWFVSLFFLDTDLAGHTLVHKVPEGWLWMVSKKLGFSRNLPHEGEFQLLVGLRLLTYITVSEGKFQFDDWKINNCFKNYNKDMIIRRLRNDLDVDMIIEKRLEKVEDSKFSGMLETLQALYSCPMNDNRDCINCPHTCEASTIRSVHGIATI